MQFGNGSIKKMTDSELADAIRGETIRESKNFRVDVREYDKARARKRRLIMERKRREDLATACMDQAETNKPETAEPETSSLVINDWTDIPFLSDDEISDYEDYSEC